MYADPTPELQSTFSTFLVGLKGEGYFSSSGTHFLKGCEGGGWQLCPFLVNFGGKNVFGQIEIGGCGSTRLICGLRVEWGGGGGCNGNIWERSTNGWWGRRIDYRNEVRV